MTLGSAILAGARAATPMSNKPVGPLEFIESDWGLKMKLYPVQRVIIKAHYGIPLDDTTPFTITNWKRENPRQMTEKEYLEFLYSEGRSNIKEVTPGKQLPRMCLSLGRRSGKCCVGDTLVLTDRGIYPLEQLGDPTGPEIQPLVIGVSQESGRKSQSAYFYNGGVRQTFQINTHCSVGVEGTGNHRVRVLTPDGVVDWKRLDQIEVGDFLAIDRGSNLWAPNHVDVRPYHVPAVHSAACKQPDLFDERWGLLMGYLVGDGTWTTHTAMSVTVEHPETHEEVMAFFYELFGKGSFHHDKRTERTGTIRAHDKAMRHFFHLLGFDWDCKSESKRTPWVILRSPREVVRAYLQGLFETDGCVTSNGKTVSFCSASRRLARETQILLLNFGIISRIRTKRVKKYDRDYYELILMGLRSRETFAREIGFRSVKKNVPLRLGILDVGREGGDTESIPHQRLWCEKILASVPPDAPKGTKGIFRSLLGNTIKPGSSDEFTYARMKRILPIAEEWRLNPEVISHFRSLLEMDYYFDPVTSIEEGEKPVYDLNVPDGESFVANGLTNHNTSLAACIFGYETYKLILKGDPQKYYGLPATNNIQLIAVATDKDQAGLLYQEVSGHFRSCNFFAPYTANNTQSYARFQTPEDVAKYGSYSDNPGAKATIKVTFRSCVAKGLRGAGNIAVVLDEVGHFTDDGQSSAESVYDAVYPSQAAYSPKDPKDKTKATGPVEARMILISSPMGCQGFFYKMFQIGMSGGKPADDMLCIQAPTWEVNPSIEAAFLESSYAKGATVFETEFGAKFSNQTRGWIERKEDLLACVRPDARPMVRGLPRAPHFLGLDLALVGDGTAIAIGHNEPDGTIVLDLVDQMKAGEDKYKDKERLEFDDVADWVLSLSRQFYIQEGMFDLWAGIPFEQALVKRGLNQMKATPMTKILASQMYQNFKDMMWDKRLALYNYPIPQGELFCPYMAELMELQAEYVSKHVTTVEAPNMEGKHDDRSDALVRMVWLASNRMSRMVAFGRPNPGGTSILRAPALSLRQKLLRSGSHESRQIPKRPGGRYR